MRQRINGNTQAKIYSFDFRTRQDDDTIASNTASIWLASIIGDEFKGVYHNLDEFMEAIFELSKKENICLYCFDLGFHWSYIFFGLMLRGYQYTKRIAKNSVRRFTAFCTTNGTRVYSATIKSGKGAGVIYLKDLKQVYAGYKSLEAMAAAFKSKRVFYRDNLEKPHPIGQEPTKEELANSLSRSGFVFDVLKRQEGDSAFFRSFTLASYSIKKAVHHAFGHLKNPYAAYRSKKMYPKIKDEDEIKALRESIKGGLTGPTMRAIDEGFKFDCQLFIIDRTQSYPSEMKTSLLPRGEGEYFEGFELGGKRIHLYHVKIISFDSVKLHSIPTLMQKHVHFLDEADEPIYIWLWEWEYWKAYTCYTNLKMEVLGGYAYKKGVCPFGKYVQENQDIRNSLEAKGDYSGAAHYKALNVCIYGKLIQRNSKEKIIQELDDESGLMETKAEEREEEKESSYIYLPAGSAIPSLARFHLIELAERFGYENIAYVETDCLIVIANERTIAVLDSLELSKELNHWHLEAKATRAHFPMAKRYKYEREDGSAVIKGAGIDEEAFSNVYDEAEIVGTSIIMRQKKRAKGGTLLVKIEKKLREK